MSKLHACARRSDIERSANITNYEEPEASGGARLHDASTAEQAMFARMASCVRRPSSRALGGQRVARASSRLLAAGPSYPRARAGRRPRPQAAGRRRGLARAALRLRSAFRFVSIPSRSDVAPLRCCSLRDVLASLARISIKIGRRGSKKHCPPPAAQGSALGEHGTSDRRGCCALMRCRLYGGC